MTNKYSVKLGVNIDHVATLRQARMEGLPDLIDIAKIVLKSGANSIVAHLREDRRHIQDDDIYMLRELGCRFDMEMAATEEMLKIALDVKPDIVTLVPEKRIELTTEGGLDVKGRVKYLGAYVEKLESKNVPVSLFIEPSRGQVEAAGTVGASFIEIHTGTYAVSRSKSDRISRLNEIKEAVKIAKHLGLRVNAGHGLDYDNVRDIVEIEGIEELNIGFSIIARAIKVGIGQAVKDMKLLI